MSRLLHRLHVYGLVAKVRLARWRATAFGQRVMSASVRLRQLHVHFGGGSTATARETARYGRALRRTAAAVTVSRSDPGRARATFRHSAAKDRRSRHSSQR